MIWDENLNQLRALIAEECEARIRKEHQLNVYQTAEWLLRHHRQAVLEGLADLISEVMEQWDDNRRAKRRVAPEVEPERWENRIRGARETAETLGVPLCYLLKLDIEKIKQCYATVRFIGRLRAEHAAAEAEATEREVEILHPVMDGHPDMTLKQAVQELKRQTDQTIQRLESPGE